MSERSDRSSSADPVQSIGAYLALQRRLRGISQQQLAEITRIPQRSIERLEAGALAGRLTGSRRLDLDDVGTEVGEEPGAVRTLCLDFDFFVGRFRFLIRVFVVAVLVVRGRLSASRS